jgi:Mg2+-importing ATPase
MVWKRYAAEAGENVLAALESIRTGLTSHEAKERLKRTEDNQLRPGSSALLRILKQRLFSSSFLYLLLAAALLSIFLRQYIEAGLILLFIFINLALETYQEYHSAKALRLLKRYLVVHTRVRRDGKIVQVDSLKVVPGDVILVEAGDRLPADVRFLDTNGLRIDESVMTGESQPVSKISGLLRIPAVEMFEAHNVGFAGTIVTSGWGEGVVFATGKETAFGDIAALTEETKKETVFEKGIREFSRFILKMVFFTLAIIYLANIFIRNDSSSTIELLIFSLALAVSVVPEALPVILTVALSRGSLRLAQKKVVVKRLSAIEDLGSIEVLCCDKTGTLTENLLSVAKINATDERQCLTLAFASCLVKPEDRGKLHDAFDLALWQALTPHEHSEVKHSKRLDSIPFDPERRRNSVLIETLGKQEIIVRGAPEEILQRSKNVENFSRMRLMQWVAEAGRRGERTLAVAYKPFSSKKKFTLAEEQELHFVGLISFADKLKPTAHDAIIKARALHVDVKIITGDSQEVAGAVGYAVGLIKSPDDVVTGKMLDSFSIDKRREAILHGGVFARVSPRQKFDIIETLQEKFEVGFLGEGINDAPALKLANVAIVVESASDIAQEAADIVLLQKSLGAVVDGIREGRLIFANILKYLRVTLTSNFGNFYSVALASLFLPFVPLLPIQILLLDLMSDFPMIAIATDAVDGEELEKPKNYQVHSVVLMATLFGVVSSVFDFILFGALYRVSPETLQTAWFLLSLLTEVILIYSLRTRLTFFKARRASLTLTFLSFSALLIGIILPFIPFVAGVLHFVMPTPGLLLFVGTLAVGYFFATEAMKTFYYRHISPAFR